MTVGVPDDPYGSSYPVTLELTTNGPEAYPGDNSASTQVMISQLLFLPFLSIK